ncbi:MAG TPA: chromate transporter [Streptosporangiaceae bacterium]|nr:chromate transporter [Streptosporangiaceae bacterium]
MAQELERVSLAVIAREWGRIGCIGFGGPPAHIALLRTLCVRDRRWLTETEFEDSVAVCNLLPGPASTQLAIYCAWRLRGTAGALVGGLCFIVPGLVVILGLAVPFLAARPPGWVSGAALGAGAAVPAVAVAAAVALVPASWRRAGQPPATTSEAGASPPASTGDAGAFPPGARDADAVTAGPRDAGAPPDARDADMRMSGPRDAGAPPDAHDADMRLPGQPDARRARLAHVRWGGYLVAGAASGALVGPWLVLVLIACGLLEVAVRSRRARPQPPAKPQPPARPQPPERPQGPVRPAGALLLAVHTGVLAAGGLAAVAWVALKVGALSYGGGFVIIPLMQHDAVLTYHWMSAGQFLTAVALGQVTPGPVVQTVAVVGYAAAGVGGGVMASAIAFAPSFAFVLGGGRYFDRLRRNGEVQAFLTGAGPAAIGAIAGAAIPLGLSLTHVWQVGVLALAAIWLIAARRGVVTAIVGGALLGVITFLAGGPVT